MLAVDGQDGIKAEEQNEQGSGFQRLGLQRRKNTLTLLSILDRQDYAESGS